MSDRQQLIENPYGSAQRETTSGALVGVEQQRAIAEVQARMIMARANPRDTIRCMDLILRDCARESLAKEAMYAFSRGGEDITGPSIRLMESLAQRWGNIASGIKEVARHNGASECVAYAWDLETGYYDERQFQVRHWRDTKKGGYQLKDERDIYELIANMGQRRKRAVLQAVIPGEVVEAAVEQCEATLRDKADTSPDAIKRLVDAFGKIGVSKEQIEARVQRRIEAIRPAHIIQLRKIFASIKDGMSELGDWFEATAPQRQEAGGERPVGGPPVAKLDEFEARHGAANPTTDPGAPQATAAASGSTSRAPADAVSANSGAGAGPTATASASPSDPGRVETGGYDSWLDNFDALRPRDGENGPDWHTYVDGAVYLIGQASREDLGKLPVARHPQLGALREANSDLYRRITQAIAERTKSLDGAKAA